MHFHQQSKHFPHGGSIFRPSGLLELRALLFFGLVSVLFAGALAGCDAPAEQKGGALSETRGGRLIMALGQGPSNLIPPLATDAPSQEVASQLYVSPLRYDKNIQIEPYAAKSFQILDGGKHLVFTLRDDIRWTDGEPLTAADVEFTYKLMIDPATPTAYAEDFKAVKEFRVTGPYSFEVFYDKPFVRALSTWASAILPKHVLEGQDLNATRYARSPVGAGPYMFKEWVENERIVLAANPGYFEGKPGIDEVVYRIIPDQATQFLELKAGNLDFAGLTPAQYLRQTGGPWWESRFNKYRYLDSLYVYLGYNLAHPLFKDRIVRQALAHAIDKREIIQGALMGLGVPAVGPYKPDSWAFNHAIKDYDYDPAKALAMLESAGWKRSGDNGPLMKDGKPFAFTIITSQGKEERIKTCAIIQSQLARIGIRVTVRTIEWATFIKEFINERRFEAVVLGWTMGQDPDAFDVWHSSKIAKPGLNFMGYANAEADELLVRGRSVLEMSERKPIYDRFQEILFEDQPYCFLYVPYALPILSTRVSGVAPAPAGIFWNFNTWRISGANAYTQ